MSWSFGWFGVVEFFFAGLPIGWLSLDAMRLSAVHTRGIIYIFDRFDGTVHKHCNIRI